VHVGKLHSDCRAPTLLDAMWGMQLIPPPIELPRLLDATVRFIDENENENENEDDEDLRLLLAPGSPLGGARPKK
jgi:hypothetical protein